MSLFRISLANLRFPSTPDESIALAARAVREASDQGRRIVCFPECYVPGYRGLGKSVPAPDRGFLERALVGHRCRRGRRPDHGDSGNGAVGRRRTGSDRAGD